MSKSQKANFTGLGTIDLGHEFHLRQAVFKVSRTKFSGPEAALLAIKS